MMSRELAFEWTWQLQSSPERIWPLVADTNRFNQDTGLPAVQHVGGRQRNARQSLRFRRFGVPVEWDEEPFEWVRPQRFGVMRRYRAGPVSTLRVLVELLPRPDGGTHLVYRTWVRPSNLLGLLLVRIYMEVISRRAFDAVLRRYDALASGQNGHRRFVGPVQFAPGGEARLAALRSRLIERTGESNVVERLVEFVATSGTLDAARIRPYALADSWGLSRRTVLVCCLEAARSGLLELQWDLLCPLCRGAKESVSKLAEMKGTVHCETCNIDVTTSFERSVELTFRVNPAIRAVEEEAYCVGGPRVTPHVVAQQLLTPGTRRTLTVPLEPGRYRMRALGMPGGQLLIADADGATEVTCQISDVGWSHEELAVGELATLQLENASTAEKLLILERLAWTDQAATAADVIALQVFRDLFAGEILRPGEHISVGSMTVLFTDLRDSTRLYRAIGDAPALGQVLDHFDVLREAIANEDGVLVKTIGDAVMAVFRRPVAGVRAILTAQRRLATSDSASDPLYLKAGLHHGPCIVVTMNGRLDYFGSVVNLASRLERFSSGDDVIISGTVRADPEVDELLRSKESRLVAEQFPAQLKGFDAEEFQLWRVRPADDGAEGASLDYS